MQIMFKNEIITGIQQEKSSPISHNEVELWMSEMICRDFIKKLVIFVNVYLFLYTFFDRWLVITAIILGHLIKLSVAGYLAYSKTVTVEDGFKQVPF